MKFKATSLTAAVTVASLLPSAAETDIQTAHAEQKQESEIAYVKTDTLQIFSTPKETAEPTDNISFNTPVTILEMTEKWYKIYAENKTGYVKKEGISFQKQTSNPAQHIVKVDALNIRTEPNMESDILDVLTNGKFVVVEEEQGDWYKILHNGTHGYVKKEFLADASKPLVKNNVISNGSYYVATPNLRVRSGAGTNTAAIGSLQNGTQIQVVGTVGTWYKIRYKSGYGYVAKHYIIQKQQQQPQQTQQTKPAIPAVFKFPTQGKISSNFDVRWGEMHYGLDIAASGTVPIRAAASGTVVKSYYSQSYGNVVFLSHTIQGKLYTTVYAHMSDRAVNVGDTVASGQFLGNMGNTGNSYGQHLHFELHNGEWNYAKTNAVDPLPYLIR
ncbi:SH3 domain-containing protein [Bacillus manliponensis]|uniref:SH3 domain-containing protein n=1 Tax=Bacillus manliponensis TaxID=574376 RepID=UPI003512FFDA